MMLFKYIKLIDFLEMENRVIFAALPHQLGEKLTYKHTPGQLFWENVPVSIFSYIFLIF